MRNAASGLIIGLFGCAATLLAGCDDSSGSHPDADVAEAADTADMAEVRDTPEVVDDVGETEDAEGEADGLPGNPTPAGLTASFGSGGPMGNSIAGVFCRCDPPLLSTSEKIAEDGECALWRSGGAQDYSHCTPLDVGDVTVTIGATDYALTLLSGDPGNPCMFMYTGGEVTEPAPATAIRFHSTGGTDVPAFDVTMNMPATIALTEPADGATLPQGHPWQVAWDPASPDGSVRVMVQGDEQRVFCHTTAPSPLTIGIGITGNWIELGIPGMVSAHTEVEQQVDAGVPIELGVNRSGGLVNVNFDAGD